MVYDRAARLDFRVEDCEAIAPRKRVLMVRPDFFQVDYVINPHMAGNIGDVDVDRAGRQWDRLVEAYREIGLEVGVLAGKAGLPDMVFCANQTLPFPPAAGAPPGVVLSRMLSRHREAEVALISAHFEAMGYRTIPLPAGFDEPFEGMGDAIWHFRRRLLWGGHGIRTHLGVYQYLSKELDTPVIVLKLDDPDFYHLDTCLSILDDHTAMIFPGAFDQEGLKMLRQMFRRVIEAPEHEARGLFACNAHCPDGHHVIIQSGCEETNSLLRTQGFEPVEVDTSEFLKSGGSVFCMKQHHW